MYAMPEEPMGFLSRSQRLKVEKRASDDAPLCYTAEEKPVHPNFAPFTTTASKMRYDLLHGYHGCVTALISFCLIRISVERDLSHSRSVAPPPGLYDLRTSLEVC